MSKFDEKALKIFECRQEKLKTLEDIQQGKTWEEKVEEYVEKILNIFEASNLEENATIVVWQVHLYLTGKRLECKVCFEEEKEDGNVFYHEDMLGELSAFCVLKNLEKTKKAMCELNCLDVSAHMIGSIMSYFKTHLNQYFTAYFMPAGILIKIERKTNCEKMGT